MCNIIKRRFNPTYRFRDDIQRMLRAKDSGRFFKAKMIHNRIIYRYGCCIAMDAKIAKSVLFPHPVGIVVGEGVSIGEDCVVYQNVTLGRKKKDSPSYPILESGCIVYAGATVIGDSHLGEGTIVAAGSVVIDETTSAKSVLVGSPAKVVKK